MGILFHAYVPLLLLSFSLTTSAAATDDKPSQKILRYEVQDVC